MRHFLTISSSDDLAKILLHATLPGNNRANNPVRPHYDKLPIVPVRFVERVGSIRMAPRVLQAKDVGVDSRLGIARLNDHPAHEFLGALRVVSRTSSGAEPAKTTTMWCAGPKISNSLV